jgi:2-keto-4-pentenoate hydratase/2-oxohepta-3-ene-1,7-dioic acid hydratase in catechol pathway
MATKLLYLRTMSHYYRIKSAAGDSHYALRDGEYYRLLSGSPLHQPTLTGESLQASRFLAPIVPQTIFAIGLNYRDHALEMNKPIPDHPVVTMKNPASLLDPGEAIQLPRHLRSEAVDFECELAVIIGKPCKNATLANALDFVFGYTVANDVSARDWQHIHGGGQWCKGKSFDTFCPLGPCVVAREAIPDPNNLRLTSRLNGELMQDSSTAEMIFSIPELLVFLSGSMTLMPGTVILTGTPAGVGTARQPPRYLRPGDFIEVSIEGIGSLGNPLVEEV